MAVNHVPPVVRAWQAMSAWMVRGFQVVIDDDDLARLRALDRDNALIFFFTFLVQGGAFSFEKPSATAHRNPDGSTEGFRPD
jgi:glycerol-3-phosphate O-acyltransferase